MQDTGCVAGGHGPHTAKSTMGSYATSAAYAQIFCRSAPHHLNALTRTSQITHLACLGSFLVFYMVGVNLSLNRLGIITPSRVRSAGSSVGALLMGINYVGE